MFYVAGNHEYYYTGEKKYEKDEIVTIDQIQNLIVQLCNKFDNVYFLNNADHMLDDNTVILGTTLWSNISNNNMIKKINSIKDYRYIYRLTENKDIKNVDTTFIRNTHIKNVLWLMNKLKEHKDKTVVILSHHLPSFQMISEKYKDDPLNDGFASDLDFMMKSNDNLRFWLCGHTHDVIDITINRCRCLTNPRGYRHEMLSKEYSYDKTKFIVL